MGWLQEKCGKIHCGVRNPPPPPGSGFDRGGEARETPHSRCQGSSEPLSQLDALTPEQRSLEAVGGRENFLLLEIVIVGRSAQLIAVMIKFYYGPFSITGGWRFFFCWGTQWGRSGGGV